MMILIIRNDWSNWAKENEKHIASLVSSNDAICSKGCMMMYDGTKKNNVPKHLGEV